MYNEIAYFITTYNKTKPNGSTVEETEQRQVFVKEKSIRQSEFYQAQAASLKPEITLELADYLEYQNEKEILYKDTLYKVLRTYKTGNQIEIVCYGGVKHVSAKVSDKNRQEWS